MGRVKSIYGQCKKSNTPFFFKQWGDCEKETKAKIVGDDVFLCEMIENTKEFIIKTCVEAENVKNVE